MTEAVARAGRWGLATVGVAFIFPTLVVAWTIFEVTKSYSSAPYLDQWMFLSEYQDLLRKGLSASWLLAPHNEHRIPFGRILFLTDLEWFGGGNLSLIILCVIAQALGGFVFFKVTQSSQEPTAKWSLALALSMLFSLAQWQNFVQGFQVTFLLAFTASAWSIFLFSRVLFAERLAKASLAASFVLLGVATLSLANGFLAGFAMMFLAVLTRRRIWLGLAAGAAAAMIGALYTVGAGSRAGLLAYAVSHPADWLLYICEYIGGLWARAFDVEAGLYAGMLGLALTLVSAVLLFRNPDRERCVALGIVGFVLLTATLTAIGRLSDGLLQSVTSRYVTPSAYFWSGLTVFAGLTVRSFMSRVSLITSIVTGMVVVLSIQWPSSFAIYAWSKRMHCGEALLLGDQPLEAVDMLAPDPKITLHADANLRSVEILKSRGLSVFRKAETRGAEGPGPYPACR